MSPMHHISKLMSMPLKRVRVPDLENSPEALECHVFLVWLQRLGALMPHLPCAHIDCQDLKQ